MDNELEVIRTQMEETRASLADKLEALETQVLGKVEGATDAVANTVEAVNDTVETVKRTLDVRQHVRDYPWAMVGGATAVGYLLGWILPSSRAVADRKDEAGDRDSNSSYGNGHAKRNGSSRKGEREESGPIIGALQSLKSMAVGAVMNLVREAIVNHAPENLAPDLTRAVDDLTARLGGKPHKRSKRSGRNEHASEEEVSHVQRDETEVGGALGATRWTGQMPPRRFDT